MLDLYAHRPPPFDQVVSKIQPERTLRHSPLFQVMFNWRDRDQQPSFIGLDGLELEFGPGPAAVGLPRLTEAERHQLLV